ncbi:hypothetical protein [Flavobacterium sp. 140616W15]|uniref:hypothetical protein n=1 Tax=Flavobacterium sp. 140616W15 TaxID=2478552 RepID=UPI000F0CFF7E|nr:hypothetical protein [Flavobacterium sp. 140616W15]AYN04781.1 hypothetical protein EAG11_11870 [Flavobacterium sp. 140616W15]
MEKFIKQNRDFSIFYSIWFFVNFAILLISDKVGDYYFYPIGKSSVISYDGEKMHSLLHAYDITEFIFYISLPLFLLFTYKLIIKNK